jgi:hypothetical protein
MLSQRYKKGLGLISEAFLLSQKIHISSIDYPPPHVLKLLN